MPKHDYLHFPISARWEKFFIFVPLSVMFFRHLYDFFSKWVFLESLKLTFHLKRLENFTLFWRYFGGRNEQYDIRSIFEK